jgi:hypothetical protein
MQTIIYYFFSLANLTEIKGNKAIKKEITIQIRIQKIFLI